MILATFRLCALGVLLAALAVPTFAAAPAEPPTAKAAPNAPARGQSADASRSRRVELPFLLDFRSPESGPPPPTRTDSDGPHPFRETLLKRAALAAPISGAEAIRDLRLSRLPEFG